MGRLSDADPEMEIHVWAKDNRSICQCESDQQIHQTLSESWEKKEWQAVIQLPLHHPVLFTRSLKM